jgi:peptidyl-prolyl cis-trans isomerase C
MLRLISQILTISLLFSALLLCGCQAEQAEAEKLPLIKINGQDIFKEEFLAEFEKSLQKDQPLSSIEREELQRSFLVHLIDRELIHGEARQLGISVTDDDVEVALQSYLEDYADGSFEAMLKERGLTIQAWREELKEGLIMEKLLEEAVYSRIEISEMEVASYYESHRKEFDRPAQVRARQIVVADEEEGKEILELLRGGRSFSEVAAEYSLSPDSQNGGDLGFFGRGEMPPEFDEVVFKLPVNRLSDLVKTEYGYHIFMVEEKRRASRLKKREAAEEIRAILESQKKEEVYLGWLQEMRAKAEIAVDWAQLENND